MRGRNRSRSQSPSMMIGSRNAPCALVPYPFTSPRSPQCTGMRSGKRLQTAMEKTADARIRMGATSLRMLPSPRAGPPPTIALRGTNPVEQMLNEILKDGGVQLVDDLLAVALGEDESRVPQRAEVTRDRRPRGRKLFGDL